MSLTRLFSIVLALTVLSGCASNLPKPDFSIVESARIGYLVELDRHPVHSHVGTTVFNNFTTTYEPLFAFRTINGSSVPLRQVPRPDEFRELRAEDLAPVREAIEQRIEEIMQKTALALVGRSEP